MSMLPLAELFPMLAQGGAQSMTPAAAGAFNAIQAQGGQVLDPSIISNSFMNAGGVQPSSLQPTPSAVSGQGMVTSLDQPLNGFNDYLGRLSGNSLDGQALTDWQNAMGFASLLSSLGAGVVGNDSHIKGLAGNLNSMQQGALMGQNARQGESSLGGMQQAGANATADGQSALQQPSPAAQVTKQPSKASTSPSSTPSPSQGGTGYGSLNSSLMNSIASSLANQPLTDWRI